MWARILKGLNAAGAKADGLTAHVFRHNYCTMLCYQIPAVSIKMIAQLLGDTEKMVIEVYNHILLEKEDTASAIEKALNF
jgi:integrase